MTLDTFRYFWNNLYCFRRKLFPPAEDIPKTVDNKKEIKETKPLAKSENIQKNDKMLNGTEIKAKVEDKEAEELRLENEKFEAVLDRNGVTENCGNNTDFENEVIIENIRPMEVFRGLEDTSSDNVININRGLQKQKLANESQVFRYNYKENIIYGQLVMVEFGAMFRTLFILIH